MGKSQSGRGLVLAYGASALALCSFTFAAAPGWAQTAPTDEEQAASSEEDVIIVTGRRRALESAVERKRDAEVMIDSVVAEDAGALPDTSITEVLQRVSGVTAVRFAAINDPDHFSIEGTGLQVRGLSGVAGRLNGREVFSATGGRGLSWGDVTPELLAAVDVYKSSSADLIEGGTGGQVDLRTRMPFDFDGAALNMSVDATHADLRDVWTPSASILVSNRFDTPIGEIGLLADLAYSEHSSRSDFFRMEPYYRTRVGDEDYFIPGGFDYGRDAFDYERTGYYGAVQWRPTEDLEIYGTAFSARYDSNQEESGHFVTSRILAFDPAAGNHEFDEQNGLISSDALFTRDSGTFAPNSGGNINVGGNTGIRLATSSTTDVAVGFNWTPTDRLAIRGALQSVYSSADSKGYNVFPEIQLPGAFGLDLTGDLPAVTLPAGATDSLGNPANYLWGASMENYSKREGHLYAANLDFEYTFSDNDFLRELQFGVRHADRTERDRDGGFNWTALGRGWNGSPQLTFANSPAGDFELRRYEEFFHGDLPAPATFLMPSYALVGTFDKTGIHTFYGGDPRHFIIDLQPDGTLAGVAVNPFEYHPANFLRSSTINTAVYAQVRIGLDDFFVPFDGNIGVRYVEIENTSTGYYRQGNNTFMRDGVQYVLAGLAEQRTGGRSYSEVLPNLNLTFRPTDDVQVRFAINRTLDQPNFDDLRAQGSLGVIAPVPGGSPPGTIGTFQNFTSTTGNPELLPVLSDNVDLSVEWYPKQGTYLNLALFHKSLENMYFRGQIVVPVDVLYALPTPELREELAQQEGVFNSPEKATIQGFEVGGQTFFDFLPGWLSGFGLLANYTYIDSENPGDFYRDIDGVVRTNVPVVGLSESNFNTQLFYEKGPISVRLAYTWRGEYLQSTNSNGTNAEYVYFPSPGASTPVDISLPIYADAYGQLDLGVRYTLNEHLNFSVDARNLSNEVQRTLMGGYGPDGETKYIRSWFVSDRRVIFGLRYSY